MPAREGLERPFPLGLAQPAMDHAGIDTCAPEVADNALGPTLGPGEHNRPLRSRSDGGGHIRLLAKFDTDETVLHRRFGLVFGRRLVVYRLMLVLADERRDRAIERRREQECLVPARGLVEDALHLRQETEVGHLVGFVDDHHLQVVERQRTTLEQVEHAPGRGDRDVDPRPQHVGLAVD